MLHQSDYHLAFEWSVSYISVSETTVQAKTMSTIGILATPAATDSRTGNVASALGTPYSPTTTRPDADTALIGRCQQRITQFVVRIIPKV